MQGNWVLNTHLMAYETNKGHMKNWLSLGLRTQDLAASALTTKVQLNGNNQLSQSSAHAGDNVSFCMAFSPGGEVFPVNPQCKHILTGCKVFHSLHVLFAPGSTIILSVPLMNIPWQTLASVSVPGAQGTLLNPVAH